MKWTNDKPTKPGWYWYRVDKDDTEPYPVEVAMIEGALQAQWLNRDFEPVADDNGQWLPLDSPPQE